MDEGLKHEIFELHAGIPLEDFLDFFSRNRFDKMDPSMARGIYEGWARENKIDITPDAVMVFKDKDGTMHRYYTGLNKFLEQLE